jgi:HEAT repeat protein
MLLVLGNTGSPKVLPTVRRYLNASEPEVRGGAVVALGWLPEAEVVGAMCQALTDDLDVGVRLEAALALGLRPMNAVTLPAHARALREVRSAVVRLAVLRNLGHAREMLPAATDLVREAAKDPAREVRAAAMALLEEED